MFRCSCCQLVSRCPACEAKSGRCLDCGRPILPRSTRCRTCQGKRIPQPVQIQKIDWPSTDRLKEMVSVLGYRETGKRLGVSDTSVRKHLHRAILSKLPLATTPLP